MHSVIFQKRNDAGDVIDQRHTLTDWHLVPKKRPVIQPPPSITSFIDVPGKAGALDLTESLSGRTLYGNRTGELEFMILNDYQIDEKSWSGLYGSIKNWMHGQRIFVILEDDPWYYYEGRISVSNWSSDSTYSSITFNYMLSPYKKERYDSRGDWLWDDLNFDNSVIREYEFEMSGHFTTRTRVPIYGCKRKIYPIINWAYLDETEKPDEITIYSVPISFDTSEGPQDPYTWSHDGKTFTSVRISDSVNESFDDIFIMNDTVLYIFSVGYYHYSKLSIIMRGETI